MERGQGRLQIDNQHGQNPGDYPGLVTIQGVIILEKQLNLCSKPCVISIPLFPFSVQLHGSLENRQPGRIRGLGLSVGLLGRPPSPGHCHHWTCPAAPRKSPIPGAHCVTRLKIHPVGKSRFPTSCVKSDQRQLPEMMTPGTANEPGHKLEKQGLGNEMSMVRQPTLDHVPKGLEGHVHVRVWAQAQERT